MKEQIIKDVEYRINSMLAYDLMLYTKARFKDYNIENKLGSVYDNSLILEPAFEVSIVFGRQLLDFLCINRKNLTNTLYNKVASKQVNNDDVYYTLFTPSAQIAPINNPLTIQNTEHILHLIKVANKACAHLTTSHTSTPEFASLEIARHTIYKLVLIYVPEIRLNNIWWENKDEQMNAIFNT